MIRFSRTLCAHEAGPGSCPPHTEGTNTMKIDWYTKTMLTVIAACLVWMCVRSAGETVLAQAQARQAQARPDAQQRAQALWSPLPAQPVVVVGWGRINPS